MILSGKEIKRLQGEKIWIEPFNEAQLNPNSYNLRLHKDMLIYNEEVLDMKSENSYRKVEIPEEGFVLQPGELYLGRTVEHTTSKGLVPLLDGRSSIGRLGLFVHITAGLGNVGASGYWTLEMFCVKPVRIYAGVEICQIFYQPIQGAYVPYKNGKYHNNNGVQPSLLYKEFPQNSGLEAGERKAV